MSLSPRIRLLLTKF